MIKSSFFLLLIFSSCQYKTINDQKPAVIDTTLSILVAGLGDPSEDNARNTVAKKYGFKFLRVGGCVVSKELSDSMRLHNAMLYKKLEEMHGKGWNDKLFREIDLLRDLQWQVENILNHDPEIIRKNYAFGKNEYEMLYEIGLSANNNILKIHAYDWSEISGTFRKRIFYTLSIDTSVDHRFRRTDL